MKTLKNISKVLSSSLISFGASFVIGFILPMYLSVYEYGMYRNFILYINFYYVLNFGYNEGLYIKYGGKTLDEVDKATLTKEHRFSTIFQAIVTIAIVAIGLLLKDSMIVLIAIASFFMNVAYFHMLLQQSFAEFDDYTLSNIIKGLSTLIFMLIALFILNGKTHNYYTIAFALSQILTYLFLEIKFRKVKVRGLDSYKIENSAIKKTFDVGFFILFGNFLRILIGTVGQWIVNIRASIETFAQYSLASSMISVVLLAVNAVSAVFYSIISREDNDEDLIKLKDALFILGVMAGFAIFVLKIFVYRFLPAYEPSLVYMKYLILGIPHIMVITIIINNLYKTKVNSKVYFKNMLIILAAEMLATFALLLIFNDITVVAISTTATYILWYYFATKFLFKSMSLNRGNTLLLASYFVIYLFTASMENYLLGMAIYAAYLIIVLIFNYKTILKLIRK